MVDAMRAAQEAARKAIEKTYNGTMTVTEMGKAKDEKSKLTKEEPVVVLEDQPCRLSFETLGVANQSDSGAAVSQTAKLFVSPEARIKAGSKITVTQDGATIDYTHSGIPAIYPTHQEIILELFERWA